jgi:hypothetical protein
MRADIVPGVAFPDYELSEGRRAQMFAEQG